MSGASDSASSQGTPAPQSEKPDEIIDELMALHPPGFELGLDNITQLLAKLDNPHLRIPPAIHVAGTNGKGSTIAFLRAMLEAAGKRVHVHTSPHLVRFNERFRLASGAGTSSFVDDETFAKALRKVANANNGAPITVFEMLTVTAFELFASHEADCTLLEVGLGGRFDATNVITYPAVSVITPIALDHQMHLGDTPEAIAGEKAGIIKRGKTVVSAHQPFDGARDVLEDVAQRNSAPFSIGGQDFSAHQENGRLVFQDMREESAGLLDLPMPKLIGPHQIDNAATAIATLRALDPSFPVEAIEQGLQNVTWPGRMQRLVPGPLHELTVPDAELWLDGGHNPAAAQIISQTLADLEDKVERPLFLIAGMLTTKDPIGFFREFEGLARHVFTVPLDSTQADVPTDKLASIAGEAGLSAEPVANLEEALKLIGANWQYEQPPRILFCGSLYLAGDVLAKNNQEPQ